MMECDDSGKNFDLVDARYLNFDNVISVIFTKLELNTSQKRALIMNEVDARSDGSLMPDRIFKIWFSNIQKAESHATKNSVMLKTYNQSDIEQVDVSSSYHNLKLDNKYS